jgi:hypothetical protein
MAGALQMSESGFSGFYDFQEYVLRMPGRGTVSNNKDLLIYAVKSRVYATAYFQLSEPGFREALDEFDCILLIIKHKFIVCILLLLC